MRGERDVSSSAPVLANPACTARLQSCHPLSLLSEVYWGLRHILCMGKELF